MPFSPPSGVRAGFRVLGIRLLRMPSATLNSDIDVRVKGEGGRVRIGEVARLSGLSVRQVRYYTDTGLLAADRLPNGYRDYAAGSAGRARRIHALFAVGLCLSDVRRLTPCIARDSTAMCPSARRALERQVEDLQRRIDRLKEAQEVILDRLEAR